MPIELTVDALADRLTGAGLPVDAIEAVGRFEQIVVGRISSIKKHPSADRLMLLSVDAGSYGILQIVSGAPNLRRGGRVALALPGARLGNGVEIAVGEIRGEVSQGALVSEQEIGLSEESSGVLEIPGRVSPGTALSGALKTDDLILEVEVTPNRGDCLSVLGIAREVSLLTGQRLRTRRLRFHEEDSPTDTAITVSIEDPALSPRYVARVVRNVSVAPSPVWMRARLEAVGVRSINNVVDVTNYVLLERGQPLHVFDLDRLAGSGVVVRRAQPGERVVLLDDVERALDCDDLVISDARGPVALAGIMGGSATAVHEGTRSILLEAACFAPERIRRSSRRHGLQSESSLRFERQVSAEGVAAASDRALELFSRYAGGHTASRRVDEFPGRQEPIEVNVRPARVNQLLGLDLDSREIRQALRQVSVGVRSVAGEVVCSVPDYRADLTREVDFIEEVARVIGYDRIPERLPAIPLRIGSIGRDLPGCIRKILVAEGLNEMISLRFTSSEQNEGFSGLAEGRGVRIVNPHTADTDEMRMSLIPGLLAVMQRNQNHGEGWFRGFEIGTVFWEQNRIIERNVLAGSLGGTRPARSISEEPCEETFYDAKGVLETLFEGLGLREMTWERAGVPGFLHPGLSANLVVAGNSIGYVGTLHPSVVRALNAPERAWVFELDTEKLELYSSRRITFQQLPRFPAVVRDLSIVAEEGLEAHTFVGLVAGCTDLLVENVQLFDVYRGTPLADQQKSLAISISYRAADRTLTDEEVNRLHTELVSRVTSQLGVEIR